MKKLNILLLFLFVQNVLLAQVLYTPFINTIEESYTFIYVTAGDVDGDGLDEILGISRRNDISRVHLLDISSSGEITLLQEFEVIDYSFFPNIFDADNDGDLDIIWPNITQVSYFANDGSGNFSTDESFFFSFVGEIYFEDYDNDGDRDILHSEYPNYQLMENVNGVFTDNQEVDIEPFSRYLNLVDLDNDDDLDIVSIRGGIGINSEIRFSYNENGTYGSPILISVLPTGVNPSKIEVGDLNNDGFVDLGYVLHNSTKCIISYNAGDNLDFTDTEEIFFADQKGGRDMELIDIDNDNDLDVFLGSANADFYDPINSWLINEGDSLTLQEPILTNVGALGWTYFVPVEYDGDAGKEIAAISIVYNRAYALNFDVTQDALLLDGKYEGINNGTFSVFDVDADMDGDDDLLVFGSNSRNITWFENAAPNVDNTSHPVSYGQHTTGYRFVLDLNGDGFKDIISSTNSSTASGNKTYVYWNQPTTNGFSDSIFLTETLFQKVEVLDADGDNDLDLLINEYASNDYFLLENLDGNGTYSDPILVYSQITTANIVSTTTDVDNDGDTDIILSANNFLAPGLEYAIMLLKNDGTGDFSDVSHLYIYPAQAATIDLEMHDMNGDGLEDLVYKALVDNNTEIGICYKIPGTDQFSTPSINLLNIPSGYQSYPTLIIEDIDLDGDKDIIDGIPFGGNEEVVIFIENRDNSGQFNYQTIAPPAPLANLANLIDMDDDGDKDFIFNDGFKIFWTENTAIHPYWLEGDLVADTILNCMQDAGEVLIDDWIIIAEQSSYQLAVVTDSLGHYRMPIDSGEWVISAISKSDYWTPCFEDSLIVMSAIGDTIVTDFYMQPNGDCGFLEWEITNNGRFRLCETNTSSIEICNYGIETLDDIQLEVVIDPLLTFESSSHPFIMISPDSILIEIGSLAFNECEIITFDVFTPCDSVALFTAPCINYQILPNDICPPGDSLWDGSIITVDGFCTNDSIYFTLQNIGSSGMSIPAELRVEIINDDIVMLFEADDYQLGIMEIKQLSYATQGQGLRLEANQTANNPTGQEASVTVPNCNDLANNVVLNWLPTENGNPFTESTCNPFFGSYDPNDKRAIPTGIGAENNIERSWELDYTIRFQNTGNDTAFLVVLRDTISEHLDLATLNVRSSSHEYFYEINADRELKITYATIELPDSTTNLDESQGFIEYSISPKTDVPFGSVIENTAYIYFDFNAPIITNTVFHTIQKPVVSSVEHIQVCQDEIYLMDTVLINETIFAEYDSIHFVYVDVIPTIEVDTSVQVEVGSIYEGVLVNSDTSFTQLFIGQNGCDSLVNYEVSIFTNTISPDFQNVKVFPNPVIEQLNIIGNENRQNQNWRLVNSSGMIVWEKSLEKNENMKTISLANIPIGIYWLEVKSESGFGVWKIVKVE
ncbi:MAG: FG-GAP-like repeat-containing protein [Saprospiraceae bacterium]